MSKTAAFSIYFEARLMRSRGRAKPFDQGNFGQGGITLGVKIARGSTP